MYAPITVRPYPVLTVQVYHDGALNREYVYDGGVGSTTASYLAWLLDYEIKSDLGRAVKGIRIVAVDQWGFRTEAP
jgi:hypothetical protein